MKMAILGKPDHTIAVIIMIAAVSTPPKPSFLTENRPQGNNYTVAFKR